MDHELELLIDDIAVTNHTPKPSINEGEEMVGGCEKRFAESSGMCLVDGLLDAEYVEQMRAKVQARKKAKIAQDFLDFQSLASNSCLEENAVRVSAVFKSEDGDIGADLESAMTKIFVDVHDLSAIGAKLVGQIEVERSKFAAEQKSRLECQNELEKVKAELEQVRRQKEKAETENAAASQRAIMYMGWWIGVKEELAKAKKELSYRRVIEAVEVVGDDNSVVVQVSNESHDGASVDNDSVGFVGVGQVDEGNRKKLGFDLNTIPEVCAEDQEEFEEGEIR